MFWIALDLGDSGSGASSVWVAIGFDLGLVTLCQPRCLQWVVVKIKWRT